MNMKLPIVTIETENGPVDINESDFDKKVHKLYEEPIKKAADKKAADKKAADKK